MKRFNNLTDSLNWLESQTKFKKKESLEPMKKALDLLNINLEGIKKIHVGGTNGKGSTSAFLTNILINNNLKVGTFTSPYLIKFNERIRVNNENINDSQLLNLINEIYNFNELLFDKEGYHLSFFELLTLMAFKYFSELKLDVIIMEIGIGGRLDATNIINYDATIITSIGLDHIKVLGSTIEEIAKEKLGALKPGGLLIANPPKEVIKTFIDHQFKNDAKGIYINNQSITKLKNNKFIYEGKRFEISLIGDYQMSNAILAYLTVKELFNFKDKDIIRPLKTVKWPGRMDLIAKNVYIDAAHNEPAIKALANTLKDNFKNKKIKIIFSALKDKDINSMLEIFKSFNFEITLTSFDDFRFDSLKQYETNDIKYVEDSIKLIKKNIKEVAKDEIVVITGSIHFIGYVLNNL